MKKTIIILCICIICGIVFNGCGRERSDSIDITDLITETDETSPEETFAEFTWPKSEIASLIPVPKSNIGKIEWEASYGFVIYVSETSEEDFNSYADSCYDVGFNIDYRRGSDYFYADNENGYHLSLNLDEDNIMFVRLDEPDNKSDKNVDVQTEASSDTPSEEPGTPESSSSENSLDNGISPEFKEVMDGYEAFVEEYCEFMKKYSEADTTDSLAMAADYTKLLNEEVEWAKKINELDNGSLNMAEAAYYIEVTNRATQKMLDVLQ